MPQYKSLLNFFLSFLDCFLELSSLKWSAGRPLGTVFIIGRRSQLTGKL